MRRTVLSWFAVSAVGAGMIVACGGTDGSTFGNGDGTDASLDGGDAGSLGNVDAGGCEGLQCQQRTCANGGTTSVSGTVLDPAGKVPLYNVIVYVPNAPLDPIKQGASCDQCGSSISGKPVVTTLTDAAGHFKLDNVPVVPNLPLVVQIGKWRRQLTVSTPLVECGDVTLDTQTTRLPRNKSEGDIPQIALTTGDCDPLECLLRKIGIDDTEFTSPSGDGRVHLYQGVSSPAQQPPAPGLPGGALASGSPPATDLWGTTASLMKYDMVLLACECDESPAEKPQAALDAMYAYTSQGGRVFGSHYHYYWLESGPKLFPGTATWDHGKPADVTTATIDDSFPKGAAFKQWMLNVGGSPAPGGTLQINDPRYDVAAVTKPETQRWIYDSSRADAVQYMTFNTPLDADDSQKCGRVVYSDLHVSSGGTAGDQPGQTFPTGCVTTDLSPQEKALEFMLFDLSSCVISDNTPPAPPPVVK